MRDGIPELVDAMDKEDIAPYGGPRLLEPTTCSPLILVLPLRLPLLLVDLLAPFQALEAGLLPRVI